MVATNVDDANWDFTYNILAKESKVATNNKYMLIFQQLQS
jgi:hypothetical protein